MAMLSLGIDLASQPVKTAACLIEWSDSDRRARVTCPVLGLTDNDLLALARRCDVIGIDAPFGWPDPFVAFLQGQRSTHESVVPWTTERRDELRFRRSDVRVRDTLGRWPLSVSTDRIALAAMRCTGLLRALGVDDRSGDGRVFEVYPAVALYAWTLAHRGYKPREGMSSRENPQLAALLESLMRHCPWLTLPDDAIRLCARSDDAFDALVASLVARAAARGLTAGPSGDEAELARREGWIAVPKPGSLGNLI